VGSYSGGMRRKLDLAMSLVGQPRILFLDEPTTGLDPRSRNALWDIVRDLARDGVTVFLTTQYLEEADQLADSVTVIDHGRVIAQGTAESLKAEVGQHVLELWFPDASATCLALSALGSHDPSTADGDYALRIPITGTPDEVYRLLDVLHCREIPVNRMALHRPTLDDVFLSLTGRDATPKETMS
ncbi:MAG TPA: AAA family ATPase, partial [Thermomicrobiales bacterium]|nr:AAA family ATPase [Thermomicrobiales bacterium]